MSAEDLILVTDLEAEYPIYLTPSGFALSPGGQALATFVPKVWRPTHVRKLPSHELVRKAEEALGGLPEPVKLAKIRYEVYDSSGQLVATADGYLLMAEVTASRDWHEVDTARRQILRRHPWLATYLATEYEGRWAVLELRIPIVTPELEQTIQQLRNQK